MISSRPLANRTIGSTLTLRINPANCTNSVASLCAFSRSTRPTAISARACLDRPDAAAEAAIAEHSASPAKPLTTPLEPLTSLSSLVRSALQTSITCAPSCSTDQGRS